MHNWPIAGFNQVVLFQRRLLSPHDHIACTCTIQDVEDAVIDVACMRGLICAATSHNGRNCQGIFLESYRCDWASHIIKEWRSRNCGSVVVLLHLLPAEAPSVHNHKLGRFLARPILLREKWKKTGYDDSKALTPSVLRNITRFYFTTRDSSKPRFFEAPLVDHCRAREVFGD